MRVHLCLGEESPTSGTVTKFLDMCGYTGAGDTGSFHIYADTDKREYVRTDVRTDNGVTIGCSDNASLFCAVCAMGRNGDLYSHFTLEDDVHLYNIGQHMLKGDLCFCLCDDYPACSTMPQHKSTLDELISYFTRHPSTDWLTQAVSAYEAGIYRKALDGRGE